jgi:hypothetical protein
MFFLSLWFVLPRAGLFSGSLFIDLVRGRKAEVQVLKLWGRRETKEAM